MTRATIAPVLATVAVAVLAGTGVVAPEPAQLSAAAAQARPADNPKGPVPRLPNGRVDLSGVWRPGDIFLIEDISLGLAKGETLPLNDWSKARMSKQLSKH